MAHLPADSGRLSWRPLHREDLADLDALLTAIEHLDEPSERHSLDELTEQLDESDAAPHRDTLLGRDAGGTLVAYAWNHVLEGDVDPRRAYVTGGIHPGWRQQGLGSAMFAWQLDQARRWHRDTWRDGFGPLRVICPIDAGSQGQRDLYENNGLTPLRWYADLVRRLDDPPPPIEAPPGVELMRMTDDHLEAVRAAHNEAFADHWGSQPIDEARWTEQLSRSTARRAWSWVALDEASGEVAGYVTNAAYEQDWHAQGFSEGWTDRLGVRRGWRHRGVARALLTASMHSYVEAGLDAAGLGVDTDNPSGGLHLYESLGFSAVNTMVLYALTEDRAQVLAALGDSNTDAGTQ